MVEVDAAAPAAGMGVLRLLPPLATVLSTACFVWGSSSTTPSGDPASAGSSVLPGCAALRKWAPA